MPQNRGVIIFGLLVILFSAGCNQNDQPGAHSTIIIDEQSVMITEGSFVSQAGVGSASATSQPNPTNAIAVQAEKSTLEAEVEWIDSSKAGEYLGAVITVRVERSYCAFKPNLNGSPTFCNDQPYPGHSFTYLMWGVDLSYLDQACVLVRGEIVEYDGKPQIVLEREDQVTLCEIEDP